MVTGSIGWRHRLAGAGLAGLMALLWWPIATLQVSSSDLMVVAFVSAVPVAAFVAWQLVPRAVLSRSALGTVVAMSLASVTMNSFVVGLIFAVSDRLNTYDRLAGPVEVALLALLYGCLGIVYFGWIALLPASISASVWTYLVRRYVRKPLGSGGNSA